MIAQRSGGRRTLRAGHGVPPTAADLADRGERLIRPPTRILGEDNLAATAAACRLAPWTVVAGNALALAPPGAARPTPPAWNRRVQCRG